MKNSILKLFFLITTLSFSFLKDNCFAQPQSESLFTKVGNYLKWENEGEVFQIEPYGQNTLRFRSSRSLHITDENWNILSQTDIKSNIRILKGKAVISNGNIRAEIREKDGLITYFNEKNEVLLKEAYHHHITRIAFR